MLIFHFLMLGIAFFQMLFMIIQWFVFKRREYFFYIAYIFSASLYILFRVNDATHFLNITLPPMLDELLDQPLVVLSYWMYVRFGKYFLNLSKLQPSVFKYSRILEIFFAVFIIAKCISIPFGISNMLSSTIYTIAVSIMTIVSVPMFVLMLKQKNLLNNFLVMGSLFYVVGGVVGMYVSISLPNIGKGNHMVFLGLEIGVLAELLLLNTGFMLKNKILQQQVIQGQQKILDQLMNKQSPKNE
jgi:7TM diverse intracellular signalling